MPQPKPKVAAKKKKKAPKKAEEKKAEEKKPVEKKAPEPAGQFVIAVGAFANPEPVVAKLAEAKLRYYTEKVATSSGTITRVRADVCRAT